MPDRRTIKSAKRALEVLEFFEKIRHPARVSEVASLLGYPQSSTSVLMNNLMGLGYLIFDPEHRTFSPTLRVALVGAWLQFGKVGRVQVYDLLVALRDKTKEATVLSTRNGVHVQYIYTLDPPGPVVMTFKAGTLRPLCRTAPGILLLAECKDEEIGLIVRRLNASAKREEIVSLATVLSQVEAARKTGYACVVGKVYPHIGSIATKLPFNDVFDKTLIVSLSGFADRIRQRQQEFIAIMRQEILEHCYDKRAKQETK